MSPMLRTGMKRTFFAMSTFLQVVELLLTNKEAKAEYTNNPSSFLDSHGLGSFDSADVSDAMGHAADALPMSVAVQLDPEQGLDSAAGIDLEAQGLSLDREPIDAEDLTDQPVDSDLDPYGAEGDVDFDAPDGELGVDPGDVVDALDAPGVPDATDTSAAAEAAPDLDSTPPVPEAISDPAPDVDTGDYLTDIPFDLADESAALDTDQLDDSAAALGAAGIDEIDTDLPDDLPDDFDLLD